MSTTRFDQLECVVCYENIARGFCLDCKQSSAICNECLGEVYDHQDEGYTCVICKKPMTYQNVIDNIGNLETYDGCLEDWANSIFVDRLRNTDKGYKLYELMLRNCFLSEN